MSPCNNTALIDYCLILIAIVIPIAIVITIGNRNAVVVAETHDFHHS